MNMSGLEGTVNFELLQSYQPEYYKRFLEMQEILKAEGAIFDNIDSQIISFWNSAFIETITEIGVERWENILGLTSNYVLPLESRKQAVQAKLKGFVKLSGTLIKSLMAIYNKGLSGDVFFEQSNINTIFNGEESIPMILDGFYDTLEQLKPSHIGLSVGVELKNSIYIKDYFEKHIYRLPMTSKSLFCGTYPEPINKGRLFKDTAAVKTDASLISAKYVIRFAGTYPSQYAFAKPEMKESYCASGELTTKTYKYVIPLAGTVNVKNRR